MEPPAASAPGRNHVERSAALRGVLRRPHLPVAQEPYCRDVVAARRECVFECAHIAMLRLHVRVHRCAPRRALSALGERRHGEVGWAGRVLRVMHTPEVPPSALALRQVAWARRCGWWIGHVACADVAAV